MTDKNIDESTDSGYCEPVQSVVVPRPIHPFPARMAASIAWKELKSSPKTLAVLDPMSGSGTSLAVASRLGHRARGIDVDPLAVLMAKVWTTHVDPERFKRAAKAALKRAKARRSAPLPKDRETREFIKYWFDEKNRRQLGALAAAIRSVKDRDVRDALWCAFSRMIITKQGGVSLAMDLAHSRPHKVRDEATLHPFDIFLLRANELAALLPAEGVRAANVALGDARKLTVKSRSIDRVITSPPYLNAIDYMRTSKYTLVWMGYTVGEVRQVRSGSIGTEFSGTPSDKLLDVTKAMGNVKRLPERYLRIVQRYVNDLSMVVREVARVLKPGGKALMVVGDCTVRGVYLKNSAAIVALAKVHGLRLTSQRSRPLPPNRRYLPPPKSASGRALRKRMAHEVLLRLARPAEVKKPLRLRLRPRRRHQPAQTLRAAS